MEEWRDIKGFEGKYMVSNLGRVKSLNYKRTGKERIMKVYDNGYGYLCVKLFKEGKRKQCRINRLVAQAFLENPEGYTDVNHRDEDKYNNCKDNLEYCSRSYNINYGTGNKRRAEKVSEKMTNNSKICKPIIAIHKINGLILEFPSLMEAERQTGISSSNICACLKGRYKSTGGYVWQYLDDNKEVCDE